MKSPTKQIIADTLYEMNKDLSLEKIRVQDLCKKCHISTQTFYNHFKDKFEVVRWIYDQDMKSVDLVVEKGTPLQFVNRLHVIEKKKPFYRNAVNAGSYDSLYFRLIEDSMDEFSFMYDKVYNRPMDADLSFILRTHAAGVSYIVCAWIKGALDLSIEKIVQLLNSGCPDQLKKLYADYMKI